MTTQLCGPGQATHLTVTWQEVIPGCTRVIATLPLPTNNQVRLTLEFLFLSSGLLGCNTGVYSKITVTVLISHSAVNGGFLFQNHPKSVDQF